MKTPQEQKKIERMFTQKQERIANAISNRDKSIAYFNSVNAAVNLIGQIEDLSKILEREEPTKEFIKEWRDWFYQQWQEWYINSMPKPPMSPQESQNWEEKGVEERLKAKEKKERMESTVRNPEHN